MERLLKTEYQLHVDSRGNPASIDLDPDYGAIDIEFIEKALRAALKPNESEALFSLKKDRTPQAIRQTLGLLFPGTVALQAAEELAHADWWAIVTYVYRQSRKLAENVARVLVKERERIGSASGARIEAAIEGARPGGLELVVAERYIEEISKLFPRMVRRAASLRILSTSMKAPQEVERYLTEASRCYVYGHFLASLFLCRSAIENAVEERLRAKGYGKKVEAITKDRLFNILKLAHDKGLLDETLYRQADDIRELANDAIHGDCLPTDDKCKNAYDQTRGILQHLYE